MQALSSLRRPQAVFARAQHLSRVSAKRSGTHSRRGYRPTASCGLGFSLFLRKENLASCDANKQTDRGRNVPDHTRDSLPQADRRNRQTGDGRHGKQRNQSRKEPSTACHGRGDPRWRGGRHCSPARLSCDEPAARAGSAVRVIQGDCGAPSLMRAAGGVFQSNLL